MIEVKNITKDYGNFRALDEISFSVEAGEVLGLLGPNGAGKTTAMRILCCFLPATSGTATVAGYDVFEDSMEIRRRLGYLPETPPLYPEMTVDSYLRFVADLREVPHSMKAGRVSEVLTRTGLSDHRNWVIGAMSKGYRQRLGLAQALIHNPEVLILDEPTVGLDPNQIIEIRTLIKELARDHTVILSTHILPEVSMTCKRVVIISEGRIVAQDTVENLERQGTDTTCYQIVMKPSGLNWADIASQIPGVKISSSEIQGGIVKFQLSVGSGEQYEKFFLAATKQGHVFTEIVPARASLEEVFIRLTKGDEGADHERSQVR